ncbi:Fe-S cluster assembly sulfur transfer protein SufU [Arcanobacterium hippocoleae]|uniref:Nitrogen fixation NifU-like protein n=1 Tax=Arcanobacterium hippocoleae TaxID=149017 RepID=A0ABU1SZR0_9ACTO|nr:SUF system NifU family Fe-S cluster assembly protein [Arcanobacterium hippocoleae]MDR6938616.1 nitrogen fixation NifU-like protein [Arcanobacterium hippocoleae]
MNDLEQLYQQIILDASRERHGEGLLTNAQGESFQVNPTCGDQVKMQVELSADGTKIEKIGWEGSGCSISQASISIMTDLLTGTSLTRFEQLSTAFREMMDGRGHAIDDATADLLDDAAAFQGVAKFPARIKCALLGWMALREATEQAGSQDGKGAASEQTCHCE